MLNGRPGDFSAGRVAVMPAKKSLAKRPQTQTLSTVNNASARKAKDVIAMGEPVTVAVVQASDNQKLQFDKMSIHSVSSEDISASNGGQCCSAAARNPAIKTGRRIQLMQVSTRSNSHIPYISRLAFNLDPIVWECRPQSF